MPNVCLVEYFSTSIIEQNIALRPNSRSQYIYGGLPQNQILDSFPMKYQSGPIQKGFIRINRSVLVNRACVYNYSFWEYDKFILRMKDEVLTEVIVSCGRMRQIKS